MIKKLFCMLFHAPWHKGEWSNGQAGPGTGSRLRCHCAKCGRQWVIDEERW